MEVAGDIEALGAEIVWVHTEDVDFSVGSVDRCIELLNQLDTAEVGWCVGDDITEPRSEAFADSRLANPGYDLIVTRHNMVIEVASTHGAGPRNENLDGAQLLEEVRRVVEQVPASVQ